MNTKVMTAVRVQVPLFLTKSNKWPVGAIVILLSSVFYLTSNWFHLFPPRLLPMTWVDERTPFIPETVWIYMSEYVFFFAIYLFSKDMENLNKYLYAFFTHQMVSVFIFVIWPTTYPRDLFPLPIGLDPITAAAFSSLRGVDTPANCCPSLHVSSVFLSTFIYLNEQRRKFPFFFLWGVAIAASTLTTKQHYLVDAVSGFLMAVVFYWVFYKSVTYKPAFGSP